jgi:hypothetical protein
MATSTSLRRMERPLGMTRARAAEIALRARGSIDTCMCWSVDTFSRQRSSCLATSVPHEMPE